MQLSHFFKDTKSALPIGRADFFLILSPFLEAQELEEQTQNAAFIQNKNSTSTFTTPYAAPIITHCVNTLSSFSALGVIDLQNDYKAKDAKELFAMGMDFAKAYELKGNYLLLSINAKLSISLESNLEKILSLKDTTKRFEQLCHKEDAIELFCAGFLMQASRRFHVVLCDGVNALKILLLADFLREDVLMRIKDSNITLLTQSAHEASSSLSYTPNILIFNAIYEKENVRFEMNYGAHAALAYAKSNDVDAIRLFQEMEYTFYSHYKASL